MSTAADLAPPAAPDWHAVFAAAVAGLPEHVEIPFAATPEGGRWAEFKHVCPAEFLRRIDRALLPQPAAFDAVANWSGTYPGPLGVGATDTGKTRAAWSALGRLHVKQGRSFAWFPARRLATELERYEKRDAADEFFRAYSHYRALFVDDIDKINWQFESQKEQLFAFYDWVYRTNTPCITTTNKDRTWWTNQMGSAFARRLFEDAHYAITF